MKFTNKVPREIIFIVCTPTHYIRNGLFVADFNRMCRVQCTTLLIGLTPPPSWFSGRFTIKKKKTYLNEIPSLYVGTTISVLEQSIL